MQKITKQELRPLVEGEINNGKLKGKTRKQITVAFGIKLHQLQGYLNHVTVNEKAIQKLGQYFGKTVDTTEHTKPTKTFCITKSRNDAEAREKRGDKTDMEAAHRRWAIDEHQAKIRERNSEYA